MAAGALCCCAVASVLLPQCSSRCCCMCCTGDDVLYLANKLRSFEAYMHKLMSAQLATSELQGGWGGWALVQRQLPTLTSFLITTRASLCSCADIQAAL
jgi:hypothetical protein